MITKAVAIVGRPNVGKSTLFNVLTKSRAALVADRPGVTRDRIYGEATLGSETVLLIDTGGISGEPETDETLENLMAGQSWQATEESDFILFVVDARDGVSNADYEIAKKLRSLNKPLILVVNKIDGCVADVVISDFYSLGLGEPLGIAAAHGRGINLLTEKLIETLGARAEVSPETEEEGEVEDIEEEVEEDITKKSIKIAIIGRPNVGKSTLVNRMLGEDRVVVFDAPGTTRDSIYIPFERQGQQYTIIDTAGVRRRGRIDDFVERFSVVKSLQAIKEADVVIYVADAVEGLTDQDANLLGFVVDVGRALVVTINKWDGLSDYQKDLTKHSMLRKLFFVDYARHRFISALHGSGVGLLFNDVIEAYKSAIKKHSTSTLNRLLEQAVIAHQPPLVNGRRIKLKLAHMGGHLPPKIIIHGNQTASVPNSYKRYLEKFYRDALHLIGTPIQIEFKSSSNPFEGRKNQLTDRQIRKKRRLIRHLKKSR
jgi:GTP-binding protein